MYWFRRLCLTCRNMTWLGPKRWLLMFVKHVGRNEGCDASWSRTPKFVSQWTLTKTSTSILPLCSSTMATENRSFADDTLNFHLVISTLPSLVTRGYQPLLKNTFSQYVLTPKSNTVWEAVWSCTLAMAGPWFQHVSNTARFKALLCHGDLGDQDRNPAVKLTSLAWLEGCLGGSLGF